MRRPIRNESGSLISMAFYPRRLAANQGCLWSVMKAPTNTRHFDQNLVLLLATRIVALCRVRLRSGCLWLQTTPSQSGYVVVRSMLSGPYSPCIRACGKSQLWSFSTDVAAQADIGFEGVSYREADALRCRNLIEPVENGHNEVIENFACTHV